jgi:hypothetical protein
MSEGKAVKTPKLLEYKRTKKTTSKKAPTKQCATPDRRAARKQVEEVKEQAIPCDCSSCRVNPADSLEKAHDEAMKQMQEKVKVYNHKTWVIVDFEGNTEDEVKDRISQGRVNAAIERTKEKALKYMFLVWVLCFWLWYLLCRANLSFLAH